MGKRRKPYTRTTVIGGFGIVDIRGDIVPGSFTTGEANVEPCVHMMNRAVALERLRVRRLARAGKKERRRAQ